MRTYFTKLGKLAAFLIPGILGFVGLHIVASPPMSPGDALYNSLTMYVLNYADSPPNILVEIARWTAPLSTASGVVLAIFAVRDRLLRYIRYHSGKSVAVYGSDPEKAEILAQLGKYGIDGSDGFVRAQRYILLQQEDQLFSFYNRYRSSLGSADVYAQCSSLQAQAVSEPHLHLFCPEETAARMFWKRRDLYALSAARGHRMKIVFLGFGKLGEELLTYALLDNVFSPQQRIEYHIFGDGALFRATHTQLDCISDPVIFYDDPWYAHLALLEQADAVIVLTQQEQLALLRQLLLATAAPGQIDVFAADTQTPRLLAGQQRLALFAWRQQAQLLENIFSDALIARAKRINLRYASLYEGVPETAEDGENAWRKLDAFTRYSNISAADYHDIRLSMLSAMGQPADPDRLSPEILELLAELEHIRWCRYHYLNNWRGGTPANGASKDPARRIHADLVPYSQLPPQEKEKNRQSVRILLALDCLQDPDAEVSA